MTRTIRRILVAVDLAKPRDTAFDRALLLARAWKAELHLLHTRRPRPVSLFAVTGEDLEIRRREAERSQALALVRSAKDAGVDAGVVIADGDPAHALVAHAQLLMADLIVVAHDFGSARLWRFPRVAPDVARSASVPVLIVPPVASPGRLAPFTRVVAAVDFTVASAVALRVATDLIARGEGHGTVVHALSFPSPMVFSGNEVSGLIGDVKWGLAQARARLRGAIPAAASRLIKPRVVAGAADQAILDVAADVDADLVIMGVSRRSRIDELFFGSTFRKVVRRSLRPILAVPVAAGTYRWAGESAAHAASGQPLAA